MAAETCGGDPLNVKDGISTMNQSFQLREATDSDKARLFDLHERLFRSHIEKIWGWNTVDQIEIFEREWTQGRIRVIEVGGAVAGALQEKLVGNVNFILSLALESGFQSLGIGSQIIEMVKKEAESSGRALGLNVFRTNPRAEEFYRRHGFKLVREGENGRRMEWIPAVRIQ